MKRAPKEMEVKITGVLDAWAGMRAAKWRVINYPS